MDDLREIVSHPICEHPRLAGKKIGIMHEGKIFVSPAFWSLLQTETTARKFSALFKSLHIVVVTEAPANFPYQTPVVKELSDRTMVIVRPGDDWLNLAIDQPTHSPSGAISTTPGTHARS